MIYGRGRERLLPLDAARNRSGDQRVLEQQQRLTGGDRVRRLSLLSAVVVLFDNSQLLSYTGDAVNSPNPLYAAS